MTAFLLVYDRASGKILEQREYDSAHRDQALKDRFARELIEREHPEIEVVVLEASSLEELRKTHRRYFESARDLISRLSA